MAGEWPTKTIDELKAKSRAAIAIGPFGSRMKSDCYVPSGVPVIRGTNISDTRDLVGEMVYITPEKAAEVQSSIIFADDLFFPHRGSIGLVGIVPRKGAARYVQSSSMMKLTCDRSLVEPLYLFYFFRSAQGRQELLKNASTVGTPGIGQPLSSLKAIHVPYPPLAEQKAIAAALGALDDKIELNRRMNATLEAMARALFQSWFVDFDPVRAKLDARPPAALDPATAALFPDSFQESELGHIPHGWKATTLGACIGFRSGFSFKSQDWQESGVPVVKIGSVKPGIIDLTQVSYVSEAIAHQAARYRLTTGDMLIGMTGYVGEVGLVPPSDNPPLLNQRVGKFVMRKPGTESLAFWYCTTRQPEFRSFVEARSHGTAQANVSGEAIMEFPLVAPSAEILDAFNRECQPMLDRILSNHAESRTLATLRDTLLPKLLSGELNATG
jgi:type I restriction enzyme S subunit